MFLRKPKSPVVVITNIVFGLNIPIKHKQKPKKKSFWKFLFS